MASGVYTQMLTNGAGKPIVFVTGNKNKAAEMSRIIGATVQPLPLDLPEIQSVNVEEVSLFKLKAAGNAYKQGQTPGEDCPPLMIEDTGLSMEGLSRNLEGVVAKTPFPGALIKFVLEAYGVEGLCAIYGGSKATAKCCVGYCDGSAIQTFVGAVPGRISKEPRGSNGFGWDKVFIPAGQEKTYAEMSGPEKDTYSMRADAVKQLLAYIKAK